MRKRPSVYHVVQLPSPLPLSVSPHSPDARECVQHGAGGTVCATLLQPTHPSPLSPPPLLCRSSIPCMYTIQYVYTPCNTFAKMFVCYQIAKVSSIKSFPSHFPHFSYNLCVLLPFTVHNEHGCNAYKFLCRNSLLILVSPPPLPASRAECCTT